MHSRIDARLTSALPVVLSLSNEVVMAKNATKKPAAEKPVVKKPKDLHAQSAEELKVTVSEALGLVSALEGHLGELSTLTKPERQSTMGRFRNGEALALTCVLDVAEAHPGAFSVLAESDGGEDPGTFETALLRDRLFATDALGALSDALDGLARRVSDTQLAMGATVHGPVLAAYEIAKVLSKHNTKARSKLAPALDFYGVGAKRKTKTK